MMRHVLPFIGLLALTAPACSDRPKGPDKGSSTAAISIGSFEPKAGDPDWRKFKLQISKQGGDPLAREYDRSEFKNSQLNDVTIKVEYNTYRFLLEYLDNSQKLVYESCPSEKSRDHVIATSVYEARITVCKLGSSTAEGEVILKPSSNVSIAPFFLEESSGGGGQTGQNPSSCKQGGTTLPGFDDVYGTCVDQKNAWYVKGGEIYRRGQAFPIKGLNWSGLESADSKLGGLWTGRSIDYFLAEIAAKGFNSLRIPLAPEVFTRSDGSDGYANPLDMLKDLLKKTEARKMGVLLDIHTCNKEVGHTSGSPLGCLNKGYTKERWLNDLRTVAELSKNYSYVLGIDLYNEPYKLTWDEWRGFVNEGSKLVLSINPNILVFVAGVGAESEYGKHLPFWGENLREAHTKRTNVPLSRLVFTPHAYGPAIDPKTYFKAADFPRNMPAIWDEHFGYLRDLGYPVVIGEFGGPSNWPQGNADKVWNNAFVAYIAKKKMNFFYWTLNPNSGDTKGLVTEESGWTAWDAQKLEILRPILQN